MGFFEDAYAGTPPWDIGRPQSDIVAAYQAGEIRGRILDVGCGTGEHALFFAKHGHHVVGIDAAATAIARAQAKAKRRGLAATFLVHDALELSKLAPPFDAVVDAGLFHVFDDGERRVFERELRRTLASGATYHLLCFSELEPGDAGPRRVRAQEIRSTFADGWLPVYIRPARFEAAFGQARAWLAHLRRE